MVRFATLKPLEKIKVKILDVQISKGFLNRTVSSQEMIPIISNGIP